jgi:hypothetical protein
VQQALLHTLGTYGPPDGSLYPRTYTGLRRNSGSAHQQGVVCHIDLLLSRL